MPILLNFDENTVVYSHFTERDDIKRFTVKNGRPHPHWGMEGGKGKFTQRNFFFGQFSRLKGFFRKETIDTYFAEVKKHLLCIPISLKEVALSALPKKESSICIYEGGEKGRNFRFKDQQIYSKVVLGTNVTIEGVFPQRDYRYPFCWSSKNTFCILPLHWKRWF